MMKHILTAIDGSPPSYRALEHAAVLARSLGAQLSVLIVRQFIVGRHDVMEVWNDDQVDAIRRTATEIVSRNGNPSHQFIEERASDVSSSIIRFAERSHADLIIMGSSGMGSIKAVMLGSVSREVLKSAACAVMIVR